METLHWLEMMDLVSNEEQEVEWQLVFMVKMGVIMFEIWIAWNVHHVSGKVKTEYAQDLTTQMC